jgi:hypothetical protein
MAKKMTKTKTGKNGRVVLMTAAAVKRRLYMRKWRADWREWEWANGPRPRYAAPGGWGGRGPDTRRIKDGPG